MNLRMKQKIEQSIDEDDSLATLSIVGAHS